MSHEDTTEYNMQICKLDH